MGVPNARQSNLTDGRLRLCNAAMSALHAGQGIAVLVLATAVTLPITTSFLTLDEATNRLVTDTREVFDMRVAALVAAFLFISAIAHVFVVLPGVNAWYNRNLDRGINYVRWWEYAFSASVMIVIIGMLSGVYDLGSLILLFGLTAAMNLCGLVMEIHNRPGGDVNWTSFYVGSIAGILPWVVIALYLLSPGTPGGDPPGFVYGIFISLFVWYLLFPVNMVLQYARIGPWRDYRVGEAGYIILSLTAKSLLAWQTFAGALTTPAA